MEVLGSVLAGFTITLTALAVGIFYVVVLVTRVAWVCQKLEAFWKERRKRKGTPQPNGAISDTIRPSGI
jgi:hypothetical protein